MAFFDIDNVVHKIVVWLSPIWGPFYAIFYLLRFLWNELFRPEE